MSSREELYAYVIAAQAALEGVVVEIRERLGQAGAVEATMTVSAMLSSLGENLEELSKTLAVAQSVGDEDTEKAVRTTLCALLSTARGVMEHAETRIK